MGLNTEGARLIDRDIIPQEKWGKPHCANHFNLDLPNPLETSKQEKSLTRQPAQRSSIPRAWTGSTQAWLHLGRLPGCSGTGNQAHGEPDLELAPRRKWEEANALPRVSSALYLRDQASMAFKFPFSELAAPPLGLKNRQIWTPILRIAYWANPTGPRGMLGSPPATGLPKTVLGKDTSYPRELALSLQMWASSFFLQTNEHNQLCLFPRMCSWNVT